MRNEKQRSLIRTSVQLVGTIVLSVLFLTLFFFFLAKKEIVALSETRLELEAENRAQAVGAWTGQVLGELGIYMQLVGEAGFEGDRVFELIASTYGKHEAYPFGLYWGTASGDYFDASGWIPGDGFVVAERVWYQEGLTHQRPAFGQPYVDARTGSLCVSATVRIEEGDLVGVLAADVYLDYLSGLLSELSTEEIEHAFFVDGTSRIVLESSDEGIAGRCLKEDGFSLLYENVNRLLSQGKMGQSRIKGEEGTYYVEIHRIEATDWYFVACLTERGMLRDFRRLELPMSAVAVVVMLVLALAAFLVAGKIDTNRQKAKTDPLTGLLNRDGFQEMLMLALETHPDQGVLMIIDMDNFKQVNDQLGHPVGDEVLKKFAVLLEDYFNRNKDIVSRIGGDEFAVFVGRSIGAPEVDLMLGKFVELVHTTFEREYPRQRLSASIGAAFVKLNSVYETLYRRADEALYEVKQRGKDGFCVR